MLQMPNTKEGNNNVEQRLITQFLFVKKITFIEASRGEIFQAALAAITIQRRSELFFKKHQRFNIVEFGVQAPELGLESQSNSVVPGKSGVEEDSRSDGMSQDSVDQRELIPSPVVPRQDRSGFASDRL